MSLKRLLPSWLGGVKPGPATHVELSAKALAQHYESGGEKVRLVKISSETGYQVPVINGRWPLMEKVLLVQDDKEYDVVCIDIPDGSVKWAIGWAFHLDPDDLVTVAPDEA